MRFLRNHRRAAAVAVIALGAGLWISCADRQTDALTGIDQGRPDIQDVQRAIAAQERHSPDLLSTPGVTGTAVGFLPNGEVGVRVFLEEAGVVEVPPFLDDVPAAAEVTGRFMAISDPTTHARPAPLGYSVGHPQITAGSIGARVVNSAGDVFILSNNHVLAASNAGSIGDPVLQPGPYDGGTVAADQIGTLAAYQPIDFSGGPNTIDAAIALSTAADVAGATPAEGYGTPSPDLFGDADHNGTIDNVFSLLGINVQKYGRTSGLTVGTVTGVNAQISVCYEVMWIFCTKSATFYDQIVIGTPGFSAGGDSGSLIVTADATANPVGLLFAGSDTETIANRIDNVLNAFNVAIDGGEPPPPPPPPGPVTDLAITDISAPANITEGGSANVMVTITNVGNQDVNTQVDVTLVDETEGDVTIGTQSFSALTVGAGILYTFPWSTSGASLGDHTLTASHNLADDDDSNDQQSAVVTVNAEATGIHVGNLDGWSSPNGNRWSATVEVTVHDANHNPINGVYVLGDWSRNGLYSNECTTGELGGNGTCIFLFPSIRRRYSSVTFTVVTLSQAGQVYDASANHDPDGSSNGTSITVIKP
jgi:hypothetical protein